MKRVLFFTMAAIAGFGLSAEEPKQQWTHGLPADLGAPPLVADMDGQPGAEMAVACGEEVLCLAANRQKLWGYSLESPAAVAAPALSGTDPLLAAAGEDGSVHCLDATTGKGLWRTEAAGDGVTGLTWADLDESGRDGLIVTTQTGGVTAYSDEGEELWTYAGEDHGHELVLQGPSAVADVDGDGLPEVFVLDRWGPFCLDSEGMLRWYKETGDRFPGTPAVADMNDDGVFELVCASEYDPLLYAFDADLGDELWRCRLSGNGVAVLALGDLNADTVAEVVAVDGQGQILVVSADGQTAWRQSGLAPGACVLGDVDGDADVEILIASNDGMLSCLTSTGTLEWRYGAGQGATGGPVLADLLGNGSLSLLQADGEKSLHCLGVGGVAINMLLPWPMDFGNPQRRASLPPATDLAEQSQGILVWETQSLLPGAGFDLGKATFPETSYPKGSTLKENRAAEPRGWVAEELAGGAWAMDTDTKLGGLASLKVTPRREAVVLVSSETAVEAALHTVSGSVMAKGEGAARVSLRWYGKNGLVREDEFRARSANNEGWRRFSLGETGRPLGADRVALALATEAVGGESTWWDEADVAGTYQRVPSGQVFVNQVGYELYGPKHFTAHGNFRASEATFSVVGLNGEAVHQGRLRRGERITGAYGNDWGGFYYRGDFSAVRTPGTLQIRVSLDKVTVISPPFEIGMDILWSGLLLPTLGAYERQRCDGPGSWCDGAASGPSEAAEALLTLVRSMLINRWRLGEDDAGLRKAWLGEVRWGAQALGRLVGQDGALAPEAREADPAAIAAGLAAAARAFPKDSEEQTAALGAAERLLRRTMENPPEGELPPERAPLLFSAAMDLLLAGKSEPRAELAKKLFPGVNLVSTESLIEYENEFDEIYSLELAMRLSEAADEFVQRAENPFGVSMQNLEGKPSFFGAPAAEIRSVPGSTRAILEAAELVSRAYRFNPAIEYKNFLSDQINWILGNNPYGVCLVSGIGDVSLPSTYRIEGKGDTPTGAVANGITCRGPGDDRPWLDMRPGAQPAPATHACPLSNSTLLMSTVANLKRIRLGEPEL